MKNKLNAIKSAVTYGDRYGAIKTLSNEELSKAIQAMETIGEISNLTITQSDVLSALRFEAETRCLA